MFRSIQQARILSCVGTVFMMAGCSGMEPAPSGKSLYDRLGGRPVITGVTDQFVANVVNDTRINVRFATTDIQKMKGQLVDQVCMVTGGPCKYTGREMKPLHAVMKITDGDFGAFGRHSRLVNGIARRSATLDILGAGILTILLLPYVALFASAGKGYLPSFGWIILAVALGQIVILTGWGDWFPWSIPALFSGAAGTRATVLGWYSYPLILIASVLGVAATFYWWRNADQTR